MQFNFNSDYPGLADSPNGPVYNPTPATPPLKFPPAQPLPCARITTRVYHPSRNQVATVHDVLVQVCTPDMARRRRRRTRGETISKHSLMDSGLPHDNTSSGGEMDDSMSSSSDGSESINSMDSNMDDAADDHNDDDDDDWIHLTQQQQHAPTRAYWLQRTIRDAIYGRVLFAIVLEKCTDTTSNNNDGQPLIAGENGNAHPPAADWQVTTQFVAVKEMSWHHIRHERDRLAEDPITEVAAMQFLQTTLLNGRGLLDAVDPLSTVLETNIMLPLDLLSDDRHLYSIMPYCNGGELFERLDSSEKFSEEEARYWMTQILNGLENLQHAGICHRDLSLENLLVHESGALIIDLGMCLRIPHQEDPSQQLSIDMKNMTMMDGGVCDSMSRAQTVCSYRRRPRHLIEPQGTCGKWIYMSPEIFRNKDPFDGHAVDVWAAGCILFLMVTGFPPWERSCMTDERFKYMSAGYLVQMLTEWNLGLSADVMDLLQRMLFLDPKDRLSLDQVRNHPWMVNGQRVPPTTA